ncbi:EXS_family protein [Hexamita inflata]|uniref:EXS_family protein n=1 Tax=Hexamita inflata TaxID=28002 RepID=A0ABP1JV91_9EUKA
MQLEVNPYWQHKYVRYDFLMNLCHQIDYQDTNEKEKIKNIFNPKITYTRPIDQQIENQSIKNLSTQFLQEIQKDFDMVDHFFIQQMEKIESQAKEAVQLSSKAQAINLDRHKCHVITQKMQECQNNSTLLQNYAILNQEQFRKLVILHDQASHHTYDANHWFEEKLQTSCYDKIDQFERIEYELYCSYSSLFKVSQKKAISDLKKQNNIQKETNKGGSIYVLLGVDTMLVLFLINLQSYFSINRLNYLSPTQQLIIRSNFIISSLFIGLGLNLIAMHSKKINYKFILQIPQEIAKKGQMQLICFAAIQFFIVTITTCCCYIGIMSERDLNVPILFRDAIYKAVSIIKPTYWLAIPIICLPIFTIFDIVKSKEKDSMASYILTTLYNVFTPWKQTIEFHHTLFCSTCISCREAFKDILNIITCNQLPDYIIVSFENIFNVFRVLQAIIRTKQMKKFYPHGFFIIQFTLNIVVTMNQISKIKNNTVAYWTIVGFRAADAIYKMYWDVFEDWGLITGGSSGIKYKYKPEQWAYGKYVRRPTQLSLWQILSYHVIDYFSVTIWIFTCFKSLNHITSQFWFSCVLQEMLVVRRVIWMIIRMDNQQITNVEQYVSTNYVPLALDDYDRKNFKRQDKQQKDQAILDQLTELNLVFNFNNGNNYILEVVNQFQKMKNKLVNVDIRDAFSSVLKSEHILDSELKSNNSNHMAEIGERNENRSPTKE